METVFGINSFAQKTENFFNCAAVRVECLLVLDRMSRGSRKFAPQAYNKIDNFSRTICVIAHKPIISKRTYARCLLCQYKIFDNINLK